MIQANAERLDSEIVYDRDFDYDYFGFKTLERSYLLRVNGKVVERPQHMLMRVAVGIHGDDIEAGVLWPHPLQGWPSLAVSVLARHRCSTLFSAPVERGCSACQERQQPRCAAPCVALHVAAHVALPGCSRGDLPSAVAALVHARVAHTVQRGHTAPAALVMLPGVHEERLY